MTASSNSLSITWKSEYNINNLKIDREHQELFTIAREALNIPKMKSEKDHIDKLKLLVKKLFTYVGTHFSNEQQHMAKIGYPDLEEHINLHKKMIDRLKNLVHDLNQMELEKIQEAIYDFIEEYFVKHIIQEDKKIQIWHSNLEDLKKNFAWKEIYSFGNKELDNDHKELFDIAKEAFKEVPNEEKNLKIKNILNRLYDYMKTHFKHEEKYMQEINYPLFSDHKKLHIQIISTINEFVKKLPNTNEDLFEKELARIIETLLISHIVHEDRKIINWLESNPISISE